MTRKLLEFTKKNWLTIVLAVVPPLAIWYFFQRDSFELTAKILVDVPVVSVRQEYGREIELRYRGAPVDGLRVVEIEIANTGTRPLERSAFDSPVTFGFGSGRVTEPLVLRTRPTSLKPQLRIADGVMSLDALLMNPTDSLVFRCFVVGGGSQPSAISVTGRVRGVSEILLRKASDSEPIWPTVLGIVVAILAGGLSMLSLVRLGMKASRLSLRLPTGLVTDLAQRLERDPGTAARVTQLAKDLDISRHDAKANLLFLRLRIESSLRDLARRADFPRQYQMGSIRRLAEELARAGIVPQEIASVIDDISPALNRELHDAESYLSEEEFDSLQRLSLNVIAGLTVALETYARRTTT